MESKLIIFVAFASMAENSFVLSSEGSPDQQKTSADFDKLQMYQDMANSEGMDGLNALFDEIQQMAAEHVYGRKRKPDWDQVSKNFSTDFIGVQKVKTAIKASYKAAMVVTGESADSRTRRSREVSYSYLAEAFAALTSALEHAKSGDYSRNRARIADLGLTVKVGFSRALGGIYGLLRTMLNPEGDVKAIIGTAETGSLSNLNQTSVAVLNAIKLYADAVSGGTYSKKVDLLFAIERYRSEALARFEGDGEYKFPLLKTIYTGRHLNWKRSISGLYEMQHFRTVAMHQYQKAFEVTFGLISRERKENFLGLGSAGEIDFSPTDCAEATFVKEVQRATDTYLNTVTFFLSETCAEVMAIEDEIFSLVQRFAFYVFKAINLADDTHDSTHSFEITDQINAVQNELPYRKIVKKFVDAIRTNLKTIEGDVALRLADLEENALVHFKNTYRRIFDATRCLVNVCSGNVTETIIGLKTETIESANAFTRVLFSAIEISIPQTHRQEQTEI